jgi:hypothetical protein
MNFPVHVESHLFRLNYYDESERQNEKDFWKGTMAMWDMEGDNSGHY